MSIKHHFVRLAEKIHGRKCSRCRHNIGGICCHPDGSTFMRCYHSMNRPGYAKKPLRLGKVVVKEHDANGITFTTDPGILTEQEKHELGKIVETLKEASATALDGGLLESPAPAIPRRDAYWDERAESGLLGEE